MAETILVTGGARSGKSRMAEQLASGFDAVTYIATSIPVDVEMRHRIDKHRQRRPDSWITVEKYRDLDRVIAGHSHSKAILLDCITVMVSNLMLDLNIDWDKASMSDFDRAEKEVMGEIGKLIDGIRCFEGRFIIVTNEVGMSLVPEYPLGRAFRDIAGFVNQRLAEISDTVYLMVSGIAVKIKG
ncbi:bifunctional adenosylcobinamide kinase/adenosylcobinamide-phosphate guanylyltransferase [Calorimonas adulescens]|uniref:Adenosylcobinamide kinase n=1 Tax=Calorimonas adulescens TaxID=2606906 RepID=A0A5D8Q8D2_9THEO|nr:bifunctional adenosylcobinamide kinase/adenosylcobinamide-phosphate guanylyltransferase [Calorimonas adulescens]TZE80900.1 bifunctional adenosylcobinamide kinase/adenosylcobinamide-phosphate guanylyltransferase [Calorimonas adulescens]